ncbi:hypothetical protein FQZ97_661940 [compost metagenome]
MGAVGLRAVGLLQRVRVDAADHRGAVVFVQARPDQGLGVQARSAGDAGPGLGVALECAGEHCVKAQAALGPVAAQAFALALAERAELVVVVGAKRGLAVAHKV